MSELNSLEKERDSWIEIANARLKQTEHAEARVKELERERDALKSGRDNCEAQYQEKVSEIGRLEAQIEIRQQAILTLEKERDGARQLIDLLRGERDISHYSYGPDEHKKRCGGGENRFRTKCFAQPRALVKGDVLATGDAVLESPRDGYNGLVSVKMEGGFEGHTIGIAGRLPIALSAALDIEQQLDAANAEVERLKGELSKEQKQNAILENSESEMSGKYATSQLQLTAAAAHLAGQAETAQRPMTDEEKREADEFLMKSFNAQRQQESTQATIWTGKVHGPLKSGPVELVQAREVLGQ